MIGQLSSIDRQLAHLEREQVERSSVHFLSPRQAETMSVVQLKPQHFGRRVVVPAMPAYAYTDDLLTADVRVRHHAQPPFIEQDLMLAEDMRVADVDCGPQTFRGVYFAIAMVLNILVWVVIIWAAHYIALEVQ